MKKLFIVLAFLLLCGSAFADAKITLYLSNGGARTWIVRDYEETETGAVFIIPSTGKRMVVYGTVTIEQL